MYIYICIYLYIYIYIENEQIFPQEDDRTEIRTTDLRVVKQTLLPIYKAGYKHIVNRKSFNLSYD